MDPRLSPIPALDPNIYTGPVRNMSGVGRTGAVAYNTYYGANGNPEFARWIYVSTTGTLVYMKWDGTTESLPGIASGIWHPIMSIQVLNTSTIPAANIRWGS
jgi:hypothetical protein